MKYMLLIYSAPVGADTADAGGIEDWMAYDKAVKDSGTYVTGHSLADLTSASTVRAGAGGDRTVTKGMFPQAPETLGGYYVIDVSGLDVALDWAGRCPGARGGGSVVVRPIAEF